nr:zinc ribbon domain-containing protein [Levilactobacillus namurensis]
MTGLLRCPECGGAMIASNTTNTLKDGTRKRTRYYSCQAFRSKGSTVCHANSIRDDTAESLVAEKLNQVLSDPNVGQKVVQQMEKRWAGQQRMIGDLMTNKQRGITELAKKKQRLQTTIDEEPSVKADLEPRIHQLTVEQVHAERDLHELQERSRGKSKGLLVDNVDQLLRLVAGVISGHDTKTLKHIYQLFIESVTFDRQKKLVWVHMRFDSDVIAGLNEYTEGTSKSSVPFLHGRTVAFVL